MSAGLPHQPVLLKEVLQGLAVRPDGIYVDGTFGRGGHAGAILALLGPQGRLLAMDKDPAAVESAGRQFGGDPRFEIEQGAFTMLSRMVAERKLGGHINGLLLDLGVSSPQLDDPSRGFSFSMTGPLDMRMDPDSGISAAEWLETASERDIAYVLKTYGEERFARRIAQSIVATRRTAPLQTTGQTLINRGQGILDGYLSGQSDVDIALELNFTEQGFNYRAQVESPLIGLSSSLPGAYTKSSEQAWPLSAVIQGDDISNLITANVDQLVYFNAILDNAKSQFNNAHFIIGNKDLGLNAQDLAVSINLAQSELLPWIDLIDQIINAAKAQPESASPGIMPPLYEVVANINSFNVSGMQFNDFDMRLSPLNNNLQLKLNAKELRAEVFIPSEQSSQPIRINSDYLRLNFLEPSLNWANSCKV